MRIAPENLTPPSRHVLHDFRVRARAFHTPGLLAVYRRKLKARSKQGGLQNRCNVFVLLSERRRARGELEARVTRNGLDARLRAGLQNAKKNNAFFAGKKQGENPTSFPGSLISRGRGGEEERPWERG